MGPTTKDYWQEDLSRTEAVWQVVEWLVRWATLEAVAYGSWWAWKNPVVAFIIVVFMLISLIIALDALTRIMRSLVRR